MAGGTWHVALFKSTVEKLRAAPNDLGNRQRYGQIDLNHDHLLHLSRALDYKITAATGRASFSTVFKISASSPRP